MFAQLYTSGFERDIEFLSGAVTILGILLFITIIVVSVLQSKVKKLSERLNLLESMYSHDKRKKP